MDPTCHACLSNTVATINTTHSLCTTYAPTHLVEGAINPLHQKSCKLYKMWLRWVALVFGSTYKQNMSWCYCVIKVDDCHFNSRSWITSLKLCVGNNLINKTSHKITHSTSQGMWSVFPRLSPCFSAGEKRGYEVRCVTLWRHGKQKSPS